jgi:hypothetical protein
MERGNSIERGNSKHGPILDEVMQQEVRGLLQGQPTDSRTEEWHDPEPSGEDQPDAAELPEPEMEHRGGAPTGITSVGTERRTRFAAYLSRSLFPADRDRLRAAAVANHAPDDVLAVLDRLPEREFRNLAEVWDAAGGGIEHQRW